MLQGRVIAEGDVSIRRADLGLSERGEDYSRCKPFLKSFNPPGGFGAFGTQWRTGHSARIGVFQSAGRIWGFRNSQSGAGVMTSARVSIRRADLGLSEREYPRGATP
ncbi:hypothetical protein OSCT_0308 [Oscillochloris trichoides DG-6]|uniref:Uncharacterized protein n=1 Tax=Oscillochloris trichoides DG-6 TaxID=765420 RepID=E1IAF7_9CHLR|nr:hypothetical protein OSCT_0308 [Oscillochloris trichoides DG-6]